MKELRLQRVLSIGVSLVAFFIAVHARAFSTGQSASLIIGPNDGNCVAYGFPGGDPPTSISLECPYGPAFDASGDLWVSDYNNSRILGFAAPFNNGASFVLGQSIFTSSVPNTTQNGLYTPRKIVFDASNNLWVADEQNNRVLEFSSSSFATNGSNAVLVLGQNDFTHVLGSGVPTAGQLSHPNGLILDASGNLWVADSVNNRVLEFSPPFSNGMSAVLAIGQPDLNTTTTRATSASALTYPRGLAFDASGNLWVTDTNNSRVLRFNAPFSNDMNASLVLGQTDFISHSQGSGSNALFDPLDLAFDASGNLWVADTDSNRILEFSPPFSTGMSASLALGNMSAPSSLAFDSSRNLWVTDTGNNRVLKFQSSSSSNPSTPVLSSTVTAGPVPLMLSRTPNVPITFRNLPSGARVRIFTLSGELLADKTENGGGTVAWDVKNAAGHQVASGVYIALITSGNDKFSLKVVVER